MNTFSNQPLVRRGDLALVSYTSTSAGGMMKKIGDVTSMFGSFPPNRNGLTQAQLRLDVQDLKVPTAVLPPIWNPSIRWA